MNTNQRNKLASCKICPTRKCRSCKSLASQTAVSGSDLYLCFRRHQEWQHRTFAANKTMAMSAHAMQKHYQWKTRLGCHKQGCASRLAVRIRASGASSGSAEYKKAAARLFVDTYVQDGQTLGLGTGELSSLCIAEIGQRIMSGKISSVKGVPTCHAAASEAAFHGLPLAPDSTDTPIDLAFDQVDAIDVNNNACVLGVTSEPQQPQLYKALVMAQQRAKRFVVLADHSKVVTKLGGTIPVLIEAATWEQAAEEVDDLVIGDAEVWRRAIPGTINPNPRGGDAPYVSEEGHNILDLRYGGEVKLFGEPISSYQELEEQLTSIDGVVATGLLLGTAHAAVVAAPAGPQNIQLAISVANIHAGGERASGSSP